MNAVSASDQTPLAQPAAFTRPFWRDPLLWGAMLLVGAMLGWLSVARYLGYNAGMLDLGHMAQAIWSGTQGQPLVFTNVDRVVSRLAGHVELIYFLFVPAYAIWPDPRVLVIAQAVLFVLGALPAYALAGRATSSVFVARCVALIYLFYPVAQTAVLFDFHADTIAMPLLLFALDALDRRAWRTYALFITLALLSKLYVAVAVLGIGVYAFRWLDERRVGAITAGSALAYGALAFLVIRPLFAPTGGDVATLSGSYVSYYFGNLGELVSTLGDRLLNALIVFGPALLVAWRGWRWLLMGAPLALAVLISTGPGAAYGYTHHHYALVVPFIVMAVIEGTRRLQEDADQMHALARQMHELARHTKLQLTPRIRSSGRSIFSRPDILSLRKWREQLGLTLAIVLIFQVLLVDTFLNPLYWLGLPGYGRDPSQYGMTARDGMKDAFLAAEVPPDVPLSASMFLGTHLANRAILYAVRYPDDPGGERLPDILPQVDYVLADALFDWRQVVAGDVLGGTPYEAREIRLLLLDPVFELVSARDGLLLFTFGAEAGQVLTQQVERSLAAELPSPIATFGAPGEGIALLDAEIEPLGPRRLRATFTWTINGTEPLEHWYVAVSRLEGAEHARLVHLPTYVLEPTTDWQPGEVVRETFDVVIPADVPPGNYDWLVGWYVVGHSESYATDERSRMPDSAEAVVDMVTVE